MSPRSRPAVPINNALPAVPADNTRQTSPCCASGSSARRPGREVARACEAGRGREHVRQAEGAVKRSASQGSTVRAARVDPWVRGIAAQGRDARHEPDTSCSLCGLGICRSFAAAVRSGVRRTSPTLLEERILWGVYLRDRERRAHTAEPRVRTCPEAATKARRPTNEYTQNRLTMEGEYRAPTLRFLVGVSDTSPATCSPPGAIVKAARCHSFKEFRFSAAT